MTNVTDVTNLAIGQRTMQCHMKIFSKFKPNKINMVEDESDGDLDYSDEVEVIEAIIAIVDLKKQMLMSEHKKDN